MLNLLREKQYVYTRPNEMRMHFDKFDLFCSINLWMNTKSHNLWANFSPNEKTFKTILYENFENISPTSNISIFHGKLSDGIKYFAWL